MSTQCKHAQKQKLQRQQSSIELLYFSHFLSTDGLESIQDSDYGYNEWQNEWTMVKMKMTSLIQFFGSVDYDFFNVLQYDFYTILLLQRKTMIWFHSKIDFLTVFCTWSLPSLHAAINAWCWFYSVHHSTEETLLALSVVLKIKPASYNKIPPPCTRQTVFSEGN